MITTNTSDILNALSKGEVVGLPTETVYGLAANAFNEAAIRKIYDLKKRPVSNPLILHTHSIDEIKKYTNSNSDKILELAKAYWPGPLTVLLEKKDIIPNIVTSGSKYVAFRIPNHPLILEVLRNFTYPLAAPSANPYQKISPTTANQVFEYFGEKISYILDGGQCNCGIESTIIGMDKQEVIIYRQGAITYEQLKKKFKNIRFHEIENTKIITSGMSKKHYAPNTKVVLVDSIETYIQNNKNLRIGVLEFGKMDLNTIAKNYYQKLYEIDKAGYDIIVAKKFKNSGIGRALNDKIERATSY